MIATPSSPSTSTDPLVDALAKRLRRADLVGWAQITAWAEQLGLSFADLRLLLALTTVNGLSSVSDLSQISGLSPHAAYPAVHGLRGRGYLRENRRRYELTEEGDKLVASLDAAHREGIKAYVDGLEASERDQLDAALGMPR